MKRITILFMVLATVACRKFEKAAPAPNTDETFLSGSDIPENFTWQNTTEVSATITLNALQTAKAGVISILDPNYNAVVSFYKKAGEYQVSFKANASSNFDSLYVYSKTVGIFTGFSINASAINLNTGGKEVEQTDLMQGLKADDCNGGCDEVISGNQGNLTVEKDETACLTGTLNGPLTLKKNAEIRICGEARLSSINTQGDDQVIIVTETGRLTISNLNINPKLTIKNYGTIEISSSINNNGELINYGTITCNGNVNLNGNSETENNEGGVFTISGSLQINNDFKNEGTVDVSGQVNLNGGAEVDNKCTFLVSGDMQINGDFKNEAFARVSGSTTINGGSKSEFDEDAIFFTKNFTLNSSEIKCDGVGLIVVENKTTVNGGAKTKEGILDICDQNGIETFNTSNTSSFMFCETVVEEGGCVIEGFDPEAEVEEELIQFSYPSTGYAYRAFEDLWPSTGDYDFNDIVVKYRLDFTANQDNQITECVANITINALGGSLRNGVALQFLKANKTRYSGKLYTNVEGTLAGIDPIDQSVVILDENVIDNLPYYYNNMGEGNDREPITTVTTITLDPSANVQVTDLIPDVFIFRSSERGLEMHMPYMPPSGAATLSHFNTFEDASEKKGYYKTTDKFPWAIEVTGSNVFYHPKSKVSIIDAYPDFSKWVRSNGNNSSDWYTNPDILLVY